MWINETARILMSTPESDKFFSQPVSSQCKLKQMRINEISFQKHTANPWNRFNATKMEKNKKYKKKK